MIPDLKDKIIKLREEISNLERNKRNLQSEINTKKERLEQLEILTINQLDIFDDESTL